MTEEGYGETEDTIKVGVMLHLEKAWALIYYGNQQLLEEDKEPIELELKDLLKSIHNRITDEYNMGSSIDITEKFENKTPETLQEVLSAAYKINKPKDLIDLW